MDMKVRKTTRRGGLNCVFQNFFFFVQELFSGSESEVVQSLSEFRVFVQWINVKNRGRKNTSNYTGSFHKPK